MMLGLSNSSDAQICKDVKIVTDNGSQTINICGNDLQEVIDKSLKIADILNS